MWTPCFVQLETVKKVYIEPIFSWYWFLHNLFIICVTQCRAKTFLIQQYFLLYNNFICHWPINEGASNNNPKRDGGLNDYIQCWQTLQNMQEPCDIVKLLLGVVCHVPLIQNSMLVTVLLLFPFYCCSIWSWGFSYVLNGQKSACDAIEDDRSMCPCWPHWDCQIGILY